MVQQASSTSFTTTISTNGVSTSSLTSSSLPVTTNIYATSNSPPDTTVAYLVSPSTNSLISNTQNNPILTTQNKPLSTTQYNPLSTTQSNTVSTTQSIFPSTTLSNQLLSASSNTLSTQNNLISTTQVSLGSNPMTTNSIVTTFITSLSTINQVGNSQPNSIISSTYKNTANSNQVTSPSISSSVTNSISGVTTNSLPPVAFIGSSNKLSDVTSKNPQTSITTTDLSVDPSSSTASSSSVQSNVRPISSDPLPVVNLLDVSTSCYVSAASCSVSEAATDSNMVPIPIFLPEETTTAIIQENDIVSSSSTTSSIDLTFLYSTLLEESLTPPEVNNDNAGVNNVQTGSITSVKQSPDDKSNSNSIIKSGLPTEKQNKMSEEVINQSQFTLRVTSPEEYKRHPTASDKLTNSPISQIFFYRPIETATLAKTYRPSLVGFPWYYQYFPYLRHYWPQPYYILQPINNYFLPEKSFQHSQTTTEKSFLKRLIFW
uniref:Uncharacterized protein n=1 Tax=Cacopsylla melanoneura TaxID=428564 RepID=A0A8D8SIU1_9HEMI